jgi:hypothetical protein
MRVRTLVNGCTLVTFDDGTFRVFSTTRRLLAFVASR